MVRTHPLAPVALALALAVPAGARAAELAWSALGGWQQGASVRVSGAVTQLFRGVPLGLQAGVGLTGLDPGSPEGARRVFINDATDGTPEERGHAWDLRLDAVLLLKRVARLEDLGIFGGVRYSMFTGRFRFVGGNEDFLVESNAWGLGGGVKGALRVNARWSVGAALGLDWYPSTTLYSHDTSYASSGEIVSGRDGYGFADADRAVNQPKLVPSVLVGAIFRP